MMRKDKMMCIYNNLWKVQRKWCVRNLKTSAHSSFITIRLSYSCLFSEPWIMLIACDPIYNF